MSRTSGSPRIITANGVIHPEPVPVTSALIDEAYIQSLLDEHPGLIPLDDIGTNWGPLVSVGREIQCGVGRIDNLFVSPTGEITIVEAKLWRNPQARREVVAQILDYAAALSAMSYEDLEQAMQAAGGPTSLWQAAGSGQEADEAAFVDAVSRNLRSGSFLLLVIGDGIKEDVESLAGMLGTQPNLGFHLALVELRLFQLGDDVLVIPSVVGRTNEVTRAIVEVRTADDGQVSVNVEAMPEPEPVDRNRLTPLASVDEYLRLAEAESGAEWAELSRRLIDWWTTEMGGYTVLNSGSVSLSLPYRHHPTNRAPIALLYAGGAGEYSNLPLSRYLEVFDEDELANHLRSLGFDGKKRIFFGAGAPSGSDEDRIRQAIEYMAGPVIAAHESETPPS